MAKPPTLEWKAVKLPTELVRRVETWACGYGKTRAEAVRNLIELGLKHGTAATAPGRTRNDRGIEHMVASQIDQLIDPDTPAEERERRIHRLTEGPPEFVGLRRDLPGRRHD